MPDPTPPGATPAPIPTGGTPAPTPPAAAEPPETGGTDDLAGLRDALAKERTARRQFESEAKKNADAARRMAEAEEADKTELQKAADRATAAETRAKAAESRLLRLDVAAAKGIPVTLAGRLVGETREELEADADDLLKVVKADSAPIPGGRERPRENLRSGTAPNAEPEDNDPTKLAAMIPRG